MIKTYLPKQVLALSTLLFYVAVAFNACGEVKFGADLEFSKNQVNSVASIIVNQGAPFTNNEVVKVQLNNPEASEVYLTNVAGCADGGEWQPYQKEVDWKLSQTNGDAVVYAKFKAKNGTGVESLCVEDGIVHDDAPPAIVVTKQPLEFTNERSAEVRFRAVDAISGVLSTQCRADGTGAFENCRELINRTQLNEGRQSVEVVATDLAGNVSAPTEVKWTVDLTAPEVSFNLVPPAMTNSRDANVIFTASDALSSVARTECKLGNGSWTVCSAPAVFAGLVEGRQELSVRAVDRAGNVSPELRHTWLIDVTAPTVTLTRFPAPRAGTRDATFEFEGRDMNVAITRFECRIDGGAFSACASPRTLTNLTEGPHRFEVRGYDNVGNVSQVAAYDWVIDVTAPVVTLQDRPPARSRDRAATFTFMATDVGTGVDVIECQIDNGASAPCTSPRAYTNLAEGQRVFRVRARDRAGNIGMPVSHTWVIDLTPPTVRIAQGPAAVVGVTEARFTIEASDPGGAAIDRIECRLDTEPEYRACSAMPVFMNLPEGRRSLTVRAFDLAGNVSQLATHNWEIDLRGPVIDFTRKPIARVSFADSIQIDYTVMDTPAGVERIECRLDNVVMACALAQGAGTVTLPPQALGPHTFAIRAWDRVGNQSMSAVTWESIEVIQFPSASNIATIAFEDNFPNPGDQDYNDAVFDFKIVETINKQIQVEKITVDFIPVAVSAGFQHQLLMVLDGEKDLPSNLLTRTPRLFNGDADIKLTYYRQDGSVESMQNILSADRDLVIFENTHRLFADANGQFLNFVNDRDEANYVRPIRTARLEVTLRQPAMNALGTRRKVNMAQYRMVLRVLRTSQDIDLVEVNPASVDVNGFPYGFIIPTNWRYPKSSQRITELYPKFNAYRDWLVNMRQNPALQPADDVLRWYEYLNPLRVNDAFRRP